jgi:hypothetical protein
LDEVRDQWERIRLSYEILSRPKMRTRYDRKEFIADPATAMKRAAVDAAVKGAVSVGKNLGRGLFQAGAFAMKHLSKKSEPKPFITSGSREDEEKPTPIPTIPDSMDDETVVVLLTGEVVAESSDQNGNPKVVSTRRTGRGFAKREYKEQ